MSGYTFFDRQYRLSCGPAGKKGFEIGATVAGQPVPLRINFSLQKTDLETQNTGKVTVWNLNDEHLSVINEDNCVLALRAGYGKNLSLIFAGIISCVETSWDGADAKTDIEVVDNLIEIRDTYISVSYQGTVNWKTIMDDVAAQMGVAVSYSYNATFADISNGFSFVGLGRDIVAKGCACCGLSWSIQNGVMQIKKPNDVMKKEVYLLRADTGLVGFPTRVSLSETESNGTKQMGWDVEFFLNGAINIDDYVKLESGIVTGYFRVYSLEINGDTESGDWLCKARLLEVAAS